jgi:hypothetical protein
MNLACLLIRHRQPDFPSAGCNLGIQGRVKVRRVLEVLAIGCERRRPNDGRD